MANNAKLQAANKAKKDEFYTQLADIERELCNYWPHFRGKTVLCNCDDPYESNFFKYFALRFNQLGLKKLICTSYNGSPVCGKELLLQFDDKPDRTAYKAVITDVPDLNDDGAVDLTDIQMLLRNGKGNILTTLQSGDFRSQECIEMLKEADIVVTNPPFSLFREYISQLVKYDKKFLIIGNQNAITYKEVFPLIMSNKLWLGYGFNAGNAFFSIPSNMSRNWASGVYNPNTGLVKFRNCCWFTNLEHTKRHQPIDLVCRYDPEEYPEYDNYKAIEVGKTAEIPCDYDGVMGVPITFLDKYCPEQFEIIGMTSEDSTLAPYWKNFHKHDRTYLQGKRMYSRILIKLKEHENRAN